MMIVKFKNLRFTLKNIFNYVVSVSHSSIIPILQAKCHNLNQDTHIYFFLLRKFCNRYFIYIYNCTLKKSELRVVANFINIKLVLNYLKKKSLTNLIFTLDPKSNNFLSFIYSGNYTSDNIILQFCEGQFCELHTSSKNLKYYAIPLFRFNTYLERNYTVEELSFRVSRNLGVSILCSLRSILLRDLQVIQLYQYLFKPTISLELYSLGRCKLIETYLKLPQNQKQGPNLRYQVCFDAHFNFSTPEFISILNQISSHEFIDRFGFLDKFMSRSFQNIKYKNLNLTLSSGGIHAHCDTAVCVFNDDSYKFGFIDLKAAYATATVYLALDEIFLKNTKFESIYPIFKGMVEERLECKDANLIQGKKLILNTLIGLFRDKYSLLYEPRLNVTVTIFVQLLMLKAIELLNESFTSTEVTLLFVNTDGLGVVYQGEDTWLKVISILNNFIKSYNMVFTYESYSFGYYKNISNYFAGGKVYKGVYTDYAHGSFKIRLYPAIVQYNLERYLKGLDYEIVYDINMYIYSENHNLYVISTGGRLLIQDIGVKTNNLSFIDLNHYYKLFLTERNLFYKYAVDDRGIDHWMLTEPVGRGHPESIKFIMSNYMSLIRALTLKGNYFPGDNLSNYTLETKKNQDIYGISLYANKTLFIIDVDNPELLDSELRDLLNNLNTLVSLKIRGGRIEFTPNQRTRWFIQTNEEIGKVSNKNSVDSGFEVLYKKAGRLIGDFELEGVSVNYVCNNKPIAFCPKVLSYLIKKKVIIMGVSKQEDLCDMSVVSKVLTQTQIDQIIYYLKSCKGHNYPITFDKENKLTVRCIGEKLHSSRSNRNMSLYVHPNGYKRFTCWHNSCINKLNKLNQVINMLIP